MEQIEGREGECSQNQSELQKSKYEPKNEMENCIHRETENGCSTKNQISSEKVDLVVHQDFSIKVLKPNEVDEGVSQSGANEQYEMMLKKERGANIDGVKLPPKTKALDLRCDCRQSSSRWGYAVTGVMLLSNVLNYMDRFTVAGILLDLLSYIRDFLLMNY